MTIDIDAIRRDIHTRQQFIDLNMPVPTFTASKVADAAPALLAELDRVRADLAAAHNHAHRQDTNLQQITRAKDEIAAERDALKAKLGRATETLEPQYLIWSHKQNAWWGPNGRRYCYDVTSAGRYTLDRANDHASTRSWPSDRKTPPEVVIPAPPLDILNDPKRCGPWLTEQIKAATDAKIATRKAELSAVAR